MGEKISGAAAVNRLKMNSIAKKGICTGTFKACWGFGFRGKKRQFFDETRRKNGSIAIPK